MSFEEDDFLTGELDVPYALSRVDKRREWYKIADGVNPIPDTEPIKDTWDSYSARVRFYRSGWSSSYADKKLTQERITGIDNEIGRLVSSGMIEEHEAGRYRKMLSSYLRKRVAINQEHMDRMVTEYNQMMSGEEERIARIARENSTTKRGRRRRG